MSRTWFPPRPSGYVTSWVERRSVFVTPVRITYRSCRKLRGGCSRAEHGLRLL